MKKYKTLEKAMKRYPQGTIITTSVGKFESTGIFTTIKSSFNKTCHKKSIWIDHHGMIAGMIYDGETKEWARIIDIQLEQQKKEPILVSEDGVNLYIGSDFYWVEKKSHNYKWTLNSHTQDEDVYVFRFSENTYQTACVITDKVKNKSFSTKEAAEKWIEEQNRPDSIFLLQDQPAKVLIGLTEDLPFQRIWDSKEGVLIYGDKEDTAYNLTFDEIDQVHKASLEYRGLV